MSTVFVSKVPSVTIFVRHSADCPRKSDEFHRGCKCPKHLRWSHGGNQIRQSAHTRTWTKAEEARRKVEAQYADDLANPQTVTLETDTRLTIEQVAKLLVTDKTAQGMGPDVLKKYKRELARFSDFLAARSKFFPAEIGLEDLTKFRAGWEKLYPSSTTRAKVQERLKSFLRYCYQSKLIDRVPHLSAIKVSEPPTLPLSKSEYAQLLEVIPQEFEPVKAARVHALIQLMRYSGLAVTDAVTLKRTELHQDAEYMRIVTDRTKTGTHVSVVIPPVVAAELRAAIKLNGHPRYCFWNSGTGRPQTAVTNWQHDLRQVFRAAGLHDGHPHQLRDTFAVWLLEKGVPLEEVSRLLGHKSIKTTEQYYAKWVKARQDRLDALVKASWD